MWRTLEQISVRDLTPDQVEMFTACAHTIGKSLRDHSRQAPTGQSGPARRPARQADRPLPRAQSRGAPRATLALRGAARTLYAERPRRPV